MVAIVTQTVPEPAVRSRQGNRTFTLGTLSAATETRTITYDATQGVRISRDPLDNAEMKEGPNLYEYVWNDPIAFVDSEGLWGAYIVGSATAEAGIRGGAAVQSGAGAGVFGGGKCGTHAGGFTDTGGFAGGGNRQQFAFGAAAGVRGGIGITNATSAGQLAGPFDTWSLNFLSPDPLRNGASMSLYDYCNGDGVNGLDPDGRHTIEAGDIPEGPTYTGGVTVASNSAAGNSPASPPQPSAPSSVTNNGGGVASSNNTNGLSFTEDNQNYYIQSTQGATPSGGDLLQSQSTGQGSAVYNPLSQAVGYTGLGASILQYSAAGNWNVGTNGGIYTSGQFYGNQYVQTAKIGDIVEAAGPVLAFGSVAIDAYGVYSGNISGVHFTTNTAMTGIGFLGVPGAVAAGGYFLLDTFYPTNNPKAGGAAAAGQDMRSFMTFSDPIFIP